MTTSPSSRCPFGVGLWLIALAALSLGFPLAVHAGYYAVAVSGDTAVVGSTDTSTAYVFVLGETNWTLQAYLRPSFSDYWFGNSVALSGDTALVGGNGRAFVFVRSGTNWSEQITLTASNSDAYDSFGSSVAVSGDTSVVGAYQEDSNATGVNGNQNDDSAPNSGAAYIFVRNGTVWSQQAYLKASHTDPDDNFGTSVAISGDTVVVGAPAESSNATGVNGNLNDNSAPHSGASYVFVRNGITWSQQAYLKASNAAADDYFGYSVAVSGGTIVVGAPNEDSNTACVNGDQRDNSAEASGAAYVFLHGGTNWSQQAYLKASNADAGDSFGWSVAVSGDTVVVGAPYEDSNATRRNGDERDNSARDSGAAYVFARSGDTWSQLAYLKAFNAAPEYYFGFSVAVSEDTAEIGDSSRSGWVYSSDVKHRLIVSPEIAVEQPPGLRLLLDGSATVDFGYGLLGGGYERAFRIRNTGPADLTGLGITITGLNAGDFTVTAFPTAPVSGPCGSTAFTVTFSARGEGPRTADLHITSNDIDESPFDITLAGTGVAPLPMSITSVFGSASDVNNLGQVIGSFSGFATFTLQTCYRCRNDHDPYGDCFGGNGCWDDSHPASHAFLWTPALPNGTNGTQTDLGTFGGPNSTPSGLNDRGQVIGSANKNQKATYTYSDSCCDYNVETYYLNESFLWNPSQANGTNGSKSHLGDFSPRAINAAGDMVGGRYLWHNGKLADLGTLGAVGIGGTGTYAEDINDLGQVVGSSVTNNGNPPVEHAFFWQNGVMKDLGTLPGYINSTATGINTNRQVVGYAYNGFCCIPPFEPRGFLFTIDASGTVTSRTDLGALSIGNGPRVRINNRGQIVGTAHFTNGQPDRAFLWDSTHGLRDLTTLLGPGWAGGTLREASAINDVGQIVADGLLLTPLPTFTLSFATIQPNGQFRFTLMGEAGRSYTIQASTNSVNWTAVTNFVSATGTNLFIDAGPPSFPRRFYRAVTP